ncbi:glycoside hydrolase family 140 protein [Catalinimonas sp. 4WD22]|uniref:glycoside hydrolase family 140 protein n=1 Tax=Catalinimonas locisalis TaxID=3133978 RepID=UPI003101005F
MQKSIINTLIIFTLIFLISEEAISQNLRVSENGRFLVKSDSTPFIWIGDTAWELFHRLNQEEADLYLEDRAEKGFNVIKAVVLAEQDGLNTPNANGDIPLINNDPGQPNEAYFVHVDAIVDKAESLGMYVGMLPTWGDKFNKRWGVGPEVFTPENARTFGEYLGKRYKDKPIIWILGGDRIPEEEEDFAIIRAMAEGLEKGDGGAHLMTYHPMGGRGSSEFFHQDEWLDFNMFQSGHCGLDFPNYQFTQNDYQLTPVKPTLDGEPRYEDIPICFELNNGRHQALDVRQAAYWSILAGAFGHTYGNSNIWQMWAPGREPILGARIAWYDAIEQAGALQMGYVRRLFESRPFLDLIPDQDILSFAFNGTDQQIRAARSEDGKYLFVYTPFGKSFQVKLDKIKGERLKAYWYNPREGISTIIGEFSNDGGVRTFTPPSTGRYMDWVLILDDASMSFEAPGLEP